MSKRNIHLLFILLTIFFCQPLFAHPSCGPAPDSLLKLSSSFEQLSSRTRVAAARELSNSRIDFNAHQAIMQQGKTFVLIKNEIESARNFLRQGYSYQVIRYEIDRLTEWKVLAGEGVITGKDDLQSVRNLTTTSILLKELLNRTNNRLRQIIAYHNTLGQFQNKLDSLLMDSVMYIVPNDSVALIRYFQRLSVLNKDYEPVRIPLKTALDSIEQLEIKVNLIKFSLESDIAETESQRKELFGKIGILEVGTFGRGINNDRPFREVVAFSLGKAELVLVFFIVNHFSTLILMGLFIIGLALYLAMLNRKTRETGIPEKLNDHQLALKHPFSSATLLVITIFQFFLPLPPYVFTGLLWITSGIALSVIMRNSITPHAYRAWIIFFVLFIFVYADNILLRQSVLERWLILMLSIAGVATGIYVLAGIKKHEIKEKLILLFIGLMVVFEIMAILNYLTGGYNQAKTFMASGFFTVIVVYLMYWTARLANETLQISLKFQKGNEDEDQREQGEKLEKKVPFYLYLLFFAGCFILITRNYYFYQTMFEPLDEMLIATRTIGAFTFTYKSVFIFILVLFLSGVISRIVSFLAADNAAIQGKTKSGGLGSWLLLIRIAIITLGVLLAFISAGIAMDKFAIILGALSVGIGFGMQTLVNNLVSGLFIAFEKPVNVGDIIEINGQTGKMKSIGIRSSVVTTWDGANVIIPNGDLLNQHLVNWTMGSSRRRFDILLGVAYGTELEKTKQLLLDLMSKDPRILKHPEPIVLALEFNNSSIDLALKFWVPHFSIGFDVKSDLILAIDLLFRENGIQIPFPQRDVHIIPSPEQDETPPGADDL